MQQNSPSWDSVFMDFCKILRHKSTCIKYQTSAIVTKGNQIIGIGCNGPEETGTSCKDASRFLWGYTPHIPYAEWIQSDDFKKKHSDWSVMNETHAEVNALNWVSKKDIDDTCALYTYYSPCDHCIKHIVSYGIKKVYYYENYPGKKSCAITWDIYLKRHNVQLINITS